MIYREAFSKVIGQLAHVEFRQAIQRFLHILNVCTKFHFKMLLLINTDLLFAFKQGLLTFVKIGFVLGVSINKIIVKSCYDSGLDIAFSLMVNATDYHARRPGSVPAGCR